MNEALLIVDLQNDFLPGGALAVPSGDTVIPIMNQIAPHFKIVVASLDWHPDNHVSFATTWGLHPGQRHQGQRLWPAHCVQNTKGSAFPDSFEKKWIRKAFYKGHNKSVDSYSIFFDQRKNPASDIHSYLQEKGISELYIAGLATEYCVLETALDAKSLGYRVSVIQDGCKGVNINEKDEEKAFEKMSCQGIFLITSTEVLHALTSTV